MSEGQVLFIVVLFFCFSVGVSIWAGTDTHKKDHFVIYLDRLQKHYQRIRRD